MSPNSTDRSVVGPILDQGIFEPGADHGRVWKLLNQLSAISAIGAIVRFAFGSQSLVESAPNVPGITAGSLYLVFSVCAYFYFRDDLVSFGNPVDRGFALSVACYIQASLISTLYIITRNPESDIYLFYLIPITTAFAYLSARRSVSVFLFVGISLVIVVYVCARDRFQSSNPIEAAWSIGLHIALIRVFGLVIGAVPAWLAVDLARKSWRSKNTTLTQALLSAIPELVFIKDSGKRFISVSPGFAEFAGAPQEEIIGKDDFAFFVNEHARHFQYDDDQILKGHVPIIQGKEEKNRRISRDGKDAPQRDVIVTKVPLRNDRGEIVALLATILDVTAQKERQRTLFRWFVHDFPGPINTIRTRILPEVRRGIQMLAKEPNANVASSIEKEMIRIDTLLTFCLACGRGYGFLSGGKGDHWKRNDDVEESCEAVVDTLLAVLGPQASDIRKLKDIRVRKVCCDREKLMVIIYLLLTNAVAAVRRCQQAHHGAGDYTYEPQITIRIVSSRSDVLTVTVEDNGDGIAEADRDRIFGEGVSLNGSSGFGLYIVREFARLAKGDAYVGEKEGTGTIVVVEIRDVKVTPRKR